MCVCVYLFITLCEQGKLIIGSIFIFRDTFYSLHYTILQPSLHKAKLI